MIEQLVLTVAALLVVWRSSEWITDQAVVLARAFHVSEFAIGGVLLATATSFPEFSIALMAGLGGLKTLPVSVGNVLGANTSDLLWVLGVSALIGHLVVKKHEERGLLVAIAAALLLPFALFFTGFGSLLGLALLALFIAYAVFIFKEKTVCDLESCAPVTRGHAARAIVFFLVGTAFMLGGAKVALDNAVSIAQEAGLTSVVIGATLISIGTTIPELSVNVAAMRKRKPSIALGNAIGSCAVNLTLVLGTGLFLTPVALDASRYYLQLFAEILAALVVGYFVLRRVRMKREHGIALLALFIAFLAASLYFGRI